MTRAFDIANYTPVPTTAQMQCLKDQGYSHAYVGSSFGTVWRDQIAALEGFGFVVGEYMFPGHVHDTDREWFIDVERSPGTVINQATVRRAVDEATNKPRGPYSNRTAWLDCIGFDWDIRTEYPWMVCWDANYGWSSPRPFIPWGGFSVEDRAIVQWASTGLCGLNADLNVMEGAMATLDDEDRRDIADIVRAEVIKALGIVASTDPQSSGEVYKKNIGEIVKLQAELLRIDMEKTGQLKPRHP